MEEARGDRKKWPAASRHLIQCFFVIYIFIYFNGRRIFFLLTENIYSSSLISQSEKTAAKSLPQRQGHDWFDPKVWEDEGSPCFYAENLCHEAFGFFYDEPLIDEEAVQPRWQLNLQKARIRPPGYPDDAVIMESSRNKTDSGLPTCPYSPITNHMVLFSPFNHMLGEFYIRTLSGMVALHRTIAGRTDAERIASSWDVQTQLYMHVDQKEPLLDSHHLFLEPFTSNPILPFRALFDRASCRCLRRLFFCGFDAKEDESATIVLKPTSSVWRGQKSGREFSVPGENKWARSARVYPIVRQHLLQMLTMNNPSLEAQVAKFRSDALAPYIVTPDTDKGPTDMTSWKLVGLSQRKMRRSWIDFDNALSECNNRLNPSGVACIEVNVEVEYSNPLTQLIMHRALDMIIGIHGAALVDAVWMKDGSFVLELLPYVPDDLRMGGWTRSITQPTPLGIIYTETLLNHLGYRLGPSSVPQCKEYWQNHTAMVKCLVQRGRWDNRDFVVDNNIVEEAVTRFLLGDENGTDCGSLQQKANKSDHVFVLYNVYCSDGDISKVQHYYHEDERGGEPL